MNPLSAIFGAAVSVRNALYEHGVRRSVELAGPVVSVGNISVGGSGKTPFVIALGEWLTAHGIAYDILSRGYGRHTKGVLRVEANGDASLFGDEPLLLANRLKVPVWVGERRAEAGKAAEGAYGGRLHLLDDGFQHRALHRDFDIVLLSEDDLTSDLLPFGRLREPLKALSRANAIVLDEKASALPQYEEKTWRTRRVLVLPSNCPRRPVAFCGIARPHRFFDQLRALGVEPTAEISFRDHHRYQTSDILRLQRTARQSGADGFLTTEKDAVKLAGLNFSPLHIARLVTEVLDADSVFSDMLKKLKVRKPDWNAGFQPAAQSQRPDVAP